MTKSLKKDLKDENKYTLLFNALNIDDKEYFKYLISDLRKQLYDITIRGNALADFLGSKDAEKIPIVEKKLLKREMDALTELLDARWMLISYYQDIYLLKFKEKFTNCNSDDKKDLRK